ncbi:uncharacterized protein LOC110856512 isoform X2 [Folsomia candida]|uniref:uncharacterized protein LOC110856512 isoform X2 n=1 Tax=Folsomia candida TaxID=158441 RepID=UPI000B902EFC|nr:uncharacterized protein LOC110856512 isoform X2 [Folsomia candida]
MGKNDKHRKRPAPSPPSSGLEPSLHPTPGTATVVKSVTYCNDFEFIPGHGTLANKGPLQNVKANFNGKASFPDTPPQQMATPQPQPPPMKRFCPTGGGSYCSNSCNCSRNKETFFAAGRGPGFGNGIFNTGAPVQTSSAFASGESKTQHPIVHANQPDPKSENDEGWISYIWSFFSSS